MKKVRKLYSSPNGDRWYLVSEPAGGVFVRHEANLASGGHVTHLEIGDFLSIGHGPETTGTPQTDWHVGRGPTDPLLSTARKVTSQ